MPRMIACFALPLALVTASVAHSKPGPARTATEAALAKIKQLNDQLHAVIAVSPESLADANALDKEPTRRGPLRGVTVTAPRRHGYPERQHGDARPDCGPASSLALAGVKVPRYAFLVARLPRPARSSSARPTSPKGLTSAPRPRRAAGRDRRPGEQCLRARPYAVRLVVGHGRCSRRRKGTGGRGDRDRRVDPVPELDDGARLRRGRSPTRSINGPSHGSYLPQTLGTGVAGALLRNRLSPTPGPHPAAIATKRARRAAVALYGDTESQGHRRCGPGRDPWCILSILVPSRPGTAAGWPPGRPAQIPGSRVPRAGTSKVDRPP